MSPDKIICAVEHWDTVLDYWKPNNWSSSWLLRETGKLSYPFHLFPSTVENFFTQKNYNAITPLYRDLEYRRFDTLEPHQKFLYLIPIEQVYYFQANRDFGFSFINSKILQKVRDNLAAIVIIFPYEGEVGCKHVYPTELHLIDEWCDREMLPHKNVFFIHGNLNVEEFNFTKDIKVNLIGVSMFEEWVTNAKSESGVRTYLPKYTGDRVFLNYNRQPRVHRLLFFLELMRHNLLSCGLVSFNTASNMFYEPRPHVEVYDADLLPFLDVFETDHKMRMVIDVDTTENLASDLTLKNYEDTFISVVSETWACDDMLFFTEKIWKPIFIGHPFILIGNPGSLKKLKSWGYKTFDKWIDESYDEVVPLKERYSIILRELKRFEQFSLKQRQDIRTEMQEICLHNKQVFIERFKINFPFPHAPIQRSLKEIWDTLHFEEKL